MVRLSAARVAGAVADGPALGAAAARFVPGGLIRWGFVAYVAITAVDLLLRAPQTAQLLVDDDGLTRTQAEIAAAITQYLPQ